MELGITFGNRQEVLRYKMAHFAQIDENNTVVETLVVPDSEEHRGEEFLHELGLDGRWIQTSFTNRIRKAFAIPGSVYLEDLDAFQPPKPETNPSFVFDEREWKWVPPVPIPEDSDWAIGFGPQPEPVEKEINGQLVLVIEMPIESNVYSWNEGTTSWDLMPKNPPIPPIDQDQVE